VVGEIEERFQQARANCGEAIGTVAAQSIGGWGWAWGGWGWLGGVCVWRGTA
jgi:hypothetical protein